MKILIYGAGIVGSTYGWQLSNVDCDVTVLVRKERKRQIEEDGISIHCADYRGGVKLIEETIWRPKVIDQLSDQNDFEYIIVSTNNLHLKEVLPVLGQSVGKAHILFFQNIWDDFGEISKYLSPEQYFFGFPFMTGGGRDDKRIHCAISGIKQSNTPVGELTGEITPRITKIAEALEKANLKPMISKDIRLWLITHYTVAAGLSGGIMKAGSGKNFASNSQIIREAIKAIREGFEVCKKNGFSPKSEKANLLYYLPLPISVPIARKVYSQESLCLMFDGHTKHSPQEMKKMLEDIISSGEKYNVEMPYLKGLKQSIDI